jgi:hypothetical protein
MNKTRSYCKQITSESERWRREEEEMEEEVY